MNRAVLEAVGGDFAGAAAIDRADGVPLRPSPANVALDDDTSAAASPLQATTTAPTSTTTPATTTNAATNTTPTTTTTAPTSTTTPASKLRLGPQHVDLLKLVGEGAFGKVILVRNRLNKELYAMKAISKKLLRKKNNVQYMKSERDILTKVHHPFIVTLSFAFQTEQRLFLVMDFLAGGELFFHLKRRGLILEPEARLYLAEMILAVEFLHSMGVVHRDLKPENVLLRADGHVCLTDFGLAKEVGDNSQVRTLCGTSEYMAPEMLLRNGYTKAVDWWSLGALFFEILAGRPPFSAKTPKELDRKILSEKVSLPQHVTATAASLIRGMLEKDVNKRLGAVKSTMFAVGGVAALKSHAFFTDAGLDWHAVLARQYDPPIRPSAAADPLANFHEGFTGQVLSPSVIEETLNSHSAQASPCMSPSLSRSASVDGLQAAGGGGDDQADYLDFEFVDPGFTCTEDQLLEFDADLASRQQRSAKKKEHKAKLLEERTRKAQAVAEQQAAAEAQAAERRAQEERIAAAKAARAKDLSDRADAIRSLEAKIRARDDWEARCVVCPSFPFPSSSLSPLVSLAFHSPPPSPPTTHHCSVERAQKKVRNASKKARDMAELEAKLEAAAGDARAAGLTQDQRLKLRRKDEVAAELAAAEAELAAARSEAPPEDSAEADVQRLDELKAALQAEIDKDAAAAEQPSETASTVAPVVVTSSPTPPAQSSVAPSPSSAPPVLAPAPLPVPVPVPVPVPATKPSLPAAVAALAPTASAPTPDPPRSSPLSSSSSVPPKPVAEPAPRPGPTVAAASSSPAVASAPEPAPAPKPWAGGWAKPPSEAPLLANPGPGPAAAPQPQCLPAPAPAPVSPSDTTPAPAPAPSAAAGMSPPAAPAAPAAPAVSPAKPATSNSSLRVDAGEVVPRWLQAPARPPASPASPVSPAAVSSPPAAQTRETVPVASSVLAPVPVPALVQVVDPTPAACPPDAASAPKAKAPVSWAAVAAASK